MRNDVNGGVKLYIKISTCTDTIVFVVWLFRSPFFRGVCQWDYDNDAER